ncbi:MAG: spore coat protein CotH [Ruminococcus sp.]|nr:spore coat protein CotH [Ruminococcus sp.]
MKSYQKILAAAMAALMMTSCSDNNGSSGNDTDTSIVTETTVNAPIGDYMTNADCVPLLSINTVSQSENVLDFVTKPVNDYVSSQIATWTPGYKKPPAPYYEACTVTLTDTDGSVLTNNQTANVKVRGNWTTNYAKKPLRIKFDTKQNLLGMNDGGEMRNWILLAEYKDGSMLRNKTALSIASELYGSSGLYCADSRFVEVEINGQYWGMYLLTEQQQVNPDRVNITEPAVDYQGTDIGYFLEFDGYYSNEDTLHSFYVDYADNAPLVPFDGSDDGGGKTITCLPEKAGDRKKNIGISIKSDIYSQEQKDFIANFVNSAYEIMYAAAYEDKALVFDADMNTLSESTEITPQEAVGRVVDLSSLADMYIISELTCDADIYWSSFFMSADFGAQGSKKLRFEAPWDFDSAMGNKDRCADGTGFYAANIVPDVNGIEYKTINPWLAVLMNEEWFREIVREKWTSFYDSGVFDRAYKMIEDDKTQLSKAFERNYKRWNNIVNNSEFSNELSKESAACKTHGEAADYLGRWLRSRVSFLNDYWHK